MRSGTIRNVAMGDALAEKLGRLEGGSKVTGAAYPRHRRNLAGRQPRRQLPVLLILATAVALTAGSAAATTFRWSVPQANKTLHSFRFAKPGTVNLVNCHGKGRATATRFSTFKCGIFGQVPAHGRSVAVNVDVQATGLRTYRVVDCQTASAPLTQKLCP